MRVLFLLLILFPCFSFAVVDCKNVFASQALEPRESFEDFLWGRIQSVYGVRKIKKLPTYLQSAYSKSVQSYHLNRHHPDSILFAAGLQNFVEWAAEEFIETEPSLSEVQIAINGLRRLSEGGILVGLAKELADALYDSGGKSADRWSDHLLRLLPKALSYEAAVLEQIHTGSRESPIATAGVYSLGSYRIGRLLYGTSEKDSAQLSPPDIDMLRKTLERGVLNYTLHGSIIDGYYITKPKPRRSWWFGRF